MAIQLKRLSSASEDLELVKGVSHEKLDVQENESGIRLRKIGLCERIRNWITGSNRGRLDRLISYVHSAMMAPPLNGDSAIDFYRSLRKWSLGLCHKATSDINDIVDGLLGLKAAKAEDAFAEAKKEYETANTGCIDVKNNPVARHRNDALLAALEKNVEQQKSILNQKEWEMKVAIMELAKERGIGSVPAGNGVTGATFGKGLNGEILTVEKKNAKDPRIMNEALLPFQYSQEQICRNDPRQAEAVAFKASEFFGFDLVPPTNTDENGYSIQLYEENGVEADKTDIKTRKDFRKHELENLQMMALFNYFCGDLDGKDSNWKIQFNANDEVVNIVKFDNGNSFPELPINRRRNLITLRKMYAWKNHEWAKQPLNPRPGSRLERVLKKLCDEREQVKFLLQISDKYPGFFTRERINLMRERIAIIKAACDCRLPISRLGDTYGREVLEQRNGDLNNIRVANIMEEYFRTGDSPRRRRPVAQPPATQVAAEIPQTLIQRVFSWLPSPERFLRIPFS